MRFFCPAYIKLPKGTDSNTNVPVSQTKLVLKTKRCFIIGYGTKITLGGDTDGYKVVIADTGEIYSSNNVTPTPHLEISRSALTGKAHDPLGEGILLRRIFDVDGTETLTLPDETHSEPELDPSIQTHNTESSIQTQKPPQQLSNNDIPLDHMKMTRRMNIGTGVTGQMREEMDSPSPQQNPHNLMTKAQAKELINHARHKQMTLKWKTPVQAKKRGKSGTRYEIYCMATTFHAFDELKKRRSNVLPGDLLNDVIKGHVTFEENPNVQIPNEDEFCDVIETDTDLFYSERFNSESFSQSSDDNLCEELEWSDEFIGRVRDSAQKELECETVPLWLALAVYSNAEVWVGDRLKPLSVKHAMKLPEWKEWKEAICKEIKGLIEVGAWKEIPRKEVRTGAKVLPGKMILDIKTSDGKFVKCKARYVSRGDLSNRGEHYWESSSHQARSKSLRLFFAMAVADYGKTLKRCYVPRNLDISQAYIQRKRTDDEPEIYMELPEHTFGICRDKNSGYVALMKRHLYGEVDGGRAFERELLEFLASIGAVATVSDRMVFIWKWNGHVLKALAHVDDIVYNGSSDEICDEFFKLAEKYFKKLTGGKIAECILGIKVEWDFDKMTVKLSQRAHAEKFLNEFGYDPTTTKSKPTPMPLDANVQPNQGRRIPPTEWDYYKWCGFANWLLMTRFDMALVTNLTGRHSHNPGIEHVDLQKHALRYLAGTLDEGLIYHGNPTTLTRPYDHCNKLVGYVDSMHGAGHDTMCVIIMCNGAAVIARVLKQRVVTTSTAHSEMIALAAGTRELIWAKDFMAEMGHTQGITRVMGDNQSANMQASGDYKSSKSDHYRRVQFYVEDNIHQGVLWIDKVTTEENIADIGTKQVGPVAQFVRLRNIAHGKTPYLIVTNKVRDILDGKYDDPGQLH